MCKNGGPVSGICGMFYPFMLEWDHHIKKFGKGQNEYVKNTLDEIPINRIFFKKRF